MELGWIMGIFFVFLTIVYVAVALLAPELVGIQGKIARKIEAAHVDNTAEDQAKNSPQKDSKNSSQQ